jgi:hypothetical protein
VAGVNCRRFDVDDKILAFLVGGQKVTAERLDILNEHLAAIVSALRDLIEVEQEWMAQCRGFTEEAEQEPF